MLSYTIVTGFMFNREANIHFFTNLLSMYVCIVLKIFELLKVTILYKYNCVFP